MSRKTLFAAVTALVAAAGGTLVTAAVAHAGEQPAPVQPGSVQPGSVQPGSVQPGLAKPAAGQPASILHFRHGFRGTEAHPAHADSIWAGYADDASASTYKSVSGSWTVPTLTCSTAKDSYTSPWIGIDGYGTSTVQQIGMDDDCVGGKVSYAPWVEMYPADSIYFDETVKAGDKITASVTYQGSGKYTLVESDATQGWSKTYHLTAVATRGTAEAIFEDLGSAMPPVAKFSTLEFTDVTANGKPLAAAGHVNSTDLYRGDTQLTKNSALSGGNFSISWLRK